MATRDEHLAWCKARALEELKAGDPVAAIASMLSDVKKWDEPLYDPAVLQLLAVDAMLFGNSPDQVRRWIEGFN